MSHYIREDRISSEHLEVISCGRQEFLQYDARCRRPAGRVDYHFLYIARGHCYLGEGEDRALPAGSLILYLPGEPQYYAFHAGEESVSYFVHFSGTGSEEMLARAGLLEERIFEVGESSSLTSLFGKIADEHSLSLPLSRELAAGYLQQMIALIGRKLIRAQSNIPPGHNYRIEDICRRMHRHYRHNLSVAEYAAACNLSESRFSHLFRESTGLSPHRYLQEIRIARACELLEETDLSVFQIAVEVGIGDQNYFSRIFRQTRGCSPSAYRRRG